MVPRAILPIAACWLVSSACQPTPHLNDASVPHGPPLVLTAEPLLLGQTARLRVEGADPLRPVHWLASLADSGSPSCPAPMGGTCLDLAAPTRYLGSSTPLSSGTATLSIRPPTTLGERPVHFQAVQVLGGVPTLSTVLDSFFYSPGGDTDGDGLDNLSELTVHLTDPSASDTDQDGVDDLTEVQAGTDPNDPLDGGTPACAPDVAHETIAPGGAGVFTHVSRHPADPSMLFFGTDVGGVFRSVEEGVSAEKLTLDLPVKQIHDVAVSVDPTAASDRLFIATVTGVYRSDDLGDTWVESWEGVEPTTDSWTFPASVVAVDPSRPEVVWATIGEGDITEEYRYQDPWIVYRSDDRGETWTGALSLTLPAPADTDIETGIWARVVFDPQDSSTVYVASSRGLLATYDDGLTWYELGRGIPRESDDRGITWRDCDDPSATCPAWMATPCTDGVDCLPVRADAGAERSELRDVAVHHVHGETWLTALVENPDHANGACTGTKLWDHDLEHMTSGPYRSTDGGLTWTYMFQPEDDDVVRNYGRYVACTIASTGTWNDTTFVELAAHPTDPDHFFLATRFLLGGIIEYRGGVFQHLSREVCPDYDCFEGGRSQGLWAQQQGPGAFDLAVYDWDLEHPTVYWTHSRGVLRGDWQSDETRYRFELLESDPVDDDATLWTGYGLDDFCSIAMHASDDNQTLYVTGADAGVIRTLDAGATWSLHPANVGNDDEAYDIARDVDSGWLYVPRFQTGTDSHGLTVSTDDGDTWSVLGGYCGSACTDSDQGLDPASYIYTVGIDYSSDVSARRVLVGSRLGLQLYDPSGPDGARFTDIRGGGCPTAEHRVHHVLTWPERPGLALFTALDHNTSNAVRNGAVASAEGGIYLLDLTSGSPTCTHLQSTVGTIEPRAPLQIAVTSQPDGQTRLLATGTWFYAPAGYSTLFDWDDPAAVDWTRTLSFDDAYGGDGTLFDEATAYGKRDYTSIAVNPLDPRIVLVGMSGNPYFHGYVQQHVFVSYDGGLTFGIAHELSQLPDKDIELLQFSPDGQYLYVGPSCGSLLRVTNPFATGCSDGERCAGGVCQAP